MFNPCHMANRPATLKTAYAYCEDDKYYLKLVYEYESDDGTHQLIFPKVSFSFRQDRIPNIYTGCYDASLYLETYIDSKLLLTEVTATNYDGETITTSSASVVDCLIKKKAHKMTIEEIEKELGYKVEIVSKKGE